MQRIYRWQPAHGSGLEHMILTQDEGMIVAEGVVAGGDDESSPFGCSYRIECDAGWRTRSVEVRVAGGASLVLTADGEGRWRDAHGRALAQLDGCIDVDISATPFTNTLPIRRLSARPARPTELHVAWIRLPALDVQAALQIYTRLADGRYRFEAPDSRFKAVLEVDGDGVVLDYPALFRRVEADGC